MSKLEIKYPPGATPLDLNETNGLIPDYITTQGELNILERENILEATNWALSRNHEDILTITFAYNLHKKMFNRVWKWAGQQRLSNKNIGVMKEQIPPQLGLLFGDTNYWIENKTYAWDEIGARFHYRLVSVHAFANGNGRHARLMTDILLECNEQNPFSWGQKSFPTPLEAEGTTRTEYITALKSADNNDFARILKFVRS
jgi:Fic-DOC domain mobile mystery protein B